MTLHVNKWCVDLLNIIIIELELHSSEIGDLSWILLSYLGPLFSCSQRFLDYLAFQLFDFERT